MPPLYMGPSSAFGGAFGGKPQPIFNPKQVGNSPFGGTGTLGVGAGGGSVGPIVTPRSTGDAGPSVPSPTPPPGSTLGPQAIRASGPSQGFDPAYLQNLATAIGGLFSGNKNGSTTSFNPLGNLSEISGPSGMEGNAPQPGLPLTWLQQALNGLGFSFGSPAAPTAPTVGSVNRGGGGGGNVNQGGRGRLALQ